MKKILVLAALLAGCSALGGSEGENYQHVLRMLCAAPPGVMQTVLTTKELQVAWTFICLHVDSVPRTPVPASQQIIAEQ